MRRGGLGATFACRKAGVKLVSDSLELTVIDRKTNKQGLLKREVKNCAKHTGQLNRRLMMIHWRIKLFLKWPVRQWNRPQLLKVLRIEIIIPFRG